MGVEEKKYYASLHWTPNDVQSLRPEWTFEQCGEWHTPQLFYIVYYFVAKFTKETDVNPSHVELDNTTKAMIWNDVHDFDR